MLFFICGCSTVEKKTIPLTGPQQKKVEKRKSAVKQDMNVEKNKIAAVKKIVKKKLTWDVITFRDLQQVDLDNDGEKDIVAVYVPSLNCSGVKVIRVTKQKGEVVFNKTFMTPNAKIEIKNGVPMIIIRDINLFAGLGAKKIYLWNGNTFVLKQ